MAKVLLVDTGNLICRAFFATYREGMPVLSFEGVPTNALGLWAGLIAPLIARERPDRAIFVSDGTPSYRRSIYPEYKGNRKPKPAEFTQQQRLIDQIICESGLEYAFDPDEEADDVIATLARDLSTAADVLICSADKDFGQCVGPKVRQLRPMSESGWWPMDAARIHDKFGVTPSMMANYLALIGDVTDNIPGIPDIGPKTAARFLADEPAFEVLASRVAAKKKWSFECARDELDLNVRLATVRHVAGVRVMRGDNPDNAIERLRSLRCFKSAAALSAMLAELSAGATPRQPVAATAQMALF